MPDLQRLIDDIRSQLQASSCELSDRLRTLAEGYAEVCSETNERLRKCERLLRQQLRSEAIHLADADPVLLDTVATLDFPEKPQWDDILGMYELPQAEPLLLDVARDLNEAYAIVQPLQKLLAKHRLLALTRAPLNQRLAVMRKLDAQDKAAFVWDDDIRVFERARFAEIEIEAKEAARRRDPAALGSLVGEVERTEWREKPPGHLLGNVRRLAGSVTKATAEDELLDITGDLERAFNLLDLFGAREARTRWQAAAARARLTPDDPRHERVEPILGWLTDEDAREATDRGFQAALANLENELANDASLESLERAYYEVRRFERTIPEPLLVRYRNRSQALQIVDARRRRVLIGSAMAVALGLATTAGLLVRRHVNNTEAAALAVAVDQLIDSTSFDKARELLASRPDFASREEILQRTARLEQEETADRNRRLLFDDALAKSQLATTYEAAADKLREAKAQVRGDAERLALEKEEVRWEQFHRHEISEAESSYQKAVDEATAQLVLLEKALEDDPTGLTSEQLLATASNQVGALQTASRLVRKEIVGQATLLRSRRDALANVRTAALRRQELAAQLTAQSHISPESLDTEADLAAFAGTLGLYADALGNSERADQFRRSAAEAAAWRGALLWPRLIGQWSFLWPVTHGEVVTRQGLVAPFAASHANSPEGEDARDYEAALAMIRLREEGTKERPADHLRARLKRTFNHDLIANAFVLTRKGTGGRELQYYVDEGEDFSQRKQDEYIASICRVGYDVADVRRIRETHVRDLVNVRAIPAPQNRIAKFVKDRIDLLRLEDWESFHAELAGQIVDAHSMDGFLRFDLLKRVLETGAAGSPFFKAAVSPQLAHLQRASIDPLARWMDPDDEDASKARIEASEILKRMPPLENVVARATQARTDMDRRLRERLQMVGWLERVNGAWICRSNWKPGERHELYVAFSDKPDQKSQWRRIGDAGQQGLRVAASETSFLREGRPVFAIARPMSATEVTGR
ncbi:MAG TPA: hypothetical protein VM510_10980 [Caulifigura sp.]|nr:hypothetical protein [Caulifigura sp.]